MSEFNKNWCAFTQVQIITKTNFFVKLDWILRGENKTNVKKWLKQRNSLYHEFFHKWRYYCQILQTFVSFFQDIRAHWLPEHVPEAMGDALDRIWLSQMIFFKSLKQLCKFLTIFDCFFIIFFLFSDFTRHPTVARTFVIVIRHK